MNLKKSNREGTGKKHPCRYCKNPTPLYKIYCNRQCYNDDKNVLITCANPLCQKQKKLPKNRSEQIYCSTKCSNNTIDRKESHRKSIDTLKTKYNISNPFEIIGYEELSKKIKRNGDKISNSLNTRTEEEKLKTNNKISNSLNSKTEEEKIKIQEKVRITTNNRYGVTNIFCKNSKYRKDIDNKIRGNNLIRLNQWLLDNNLKLLDEYKGVKDEKGDIIYYKFIHIPTQTILIDHVACGRLPLYKDPNFSKGISLIENEVLEFIKSIIPNDIVISNNRKIIKGFEIDIYLPNHNLAIEFNGLYWHSENMGGKNKEYHLYKTEECEKLGIQLIHIFEDEWENKKEIVKSKILNLLNKTPNRIFARKCEIREVNNIDKNQFLNNNHIQGEDKSKFKYGLYYQNNLVAIITFGNLRKIMGSNSQEGHYELLRFCTILNTNIVGGFSRLLKHFIKINSPKCLISYADRRWSLGKLYKQNNFKFIHNTPPNYWYMKYHNYREHRFKYRKSELEKLLSIFDINLSEWENMKLNKYDRIWDSGSMKFELIF